MNANANSVFEELVRWCGELDDLVKAANRADPSSPCAIVDRAAVEAALAKAAGGLVPLGELTTWAHAVHLSDGVDIEDGHEDLVTQFLFEASTPELFEPITPEFCQRWLDEVRVSLANPPGIGR
ncbi:hypothetical protein [Kitasatospora sp. NPDC056184]|uniref:hypothetical protein n=1 Tax=Kitasatospora sp. NPDC056184 TaxID=3345738 RepID=UPI0035D9DEAE